MIKVDFKKFFLKPKVENVASTIEDLTNPLANMTPAQKTNLNLKLQDVSLYLLIAVILVTPLLFVPILANVFDLPKQTLVLMISLLLAFAWSLKTAASKKAALVTSIFDLPIVLLVAVSVVSAFLTTNRFGSLASDPLTYLGGALLFFAVTQMVKREGEVITLVKTLLVSGAILSLGLLAQTVASLLKITVPYLNFTPVGSPLVAVLFIIAITPAGISLYLKSRKKLDLIFTGLNAAGLLVASYLLYQANPALIPFEAAWKIATGTLGQSLTAAFFGFGPSNYVDAYTLFRPASLNSTPMWNLRFTSGGPFYFYVLTTLGIAGLSALVFLVYRLVILAKKRFEIGTIPVFEKGLFISLSIMLVGFAFLPSPTVLTLTFFTLLGLLVAHFALAENTSVAREKIISLPENIFVNSLMPLAVLGLTIFAGYQLGKVALADFYYAQSLFAAAENRGVDMYNLQIKALTLNPANDMYRIAYSQTNLALANSLANQVSSASATSDQQKNTITQLVQQSVREGRNAVSLAPQRAANWENLAGIYRTLINFAQGADQWTLASYNQAITLDPNNPQLRFNLGSIYFTAQNWQAAAQTFAAATSLKPDYANAHYNLAQSLKNLKLNDQAIQELQLTSSLVCATDTTNKDCVAVTQELKDLGATTATPSAVSSTETPLSTPSANNKALQKVKTTPAPKISTPSGEITQ